MNFTSTTLQRASLLIEQSRYEMAEKELRNLLLEEPQNSLAMRLLAVCLLNQEKTEEALTVSSALVGIEPDEADNLYIHALVLLNLEKDREAEHYIREAIGFYPYDAAYFEVLSRVYLQRKDWETALQFANEGLETDPTHLGCLNARTTSLTKLNRKEEARETIADVLEQDPENAWSHNNVGWAKLEQGDYKGAQIHFAEALRLDPGLDYARTGMLEALKAKNFFYRWFLQFFFWLNRFRGQTQWAIIIGIWVGQQVLRHVARQYPVLLPLVYVMIFLIYLTWVIEPLFNLFIRLDPYGKHLLTDRERQGANWTGLLLIAGLLAGVALLVTDIPNFLFISIFAFTMVLPVGRLFNADLKGKNKTILYYTIALAVIGLAGIAFAAIQAEGPAVVLYTLYLIGIFVFGWVANSIAIK